MKITKEYLGRIAKNVLNFLDKEEIKSLPDLERITGQTFSVNENEDISVSLRKSKPDEVTPVLSYIASDRETLLEAKINKKLGCSEIMVKGDFTLPGYISFYDESGELTRCRRLPASVLQLKSGLIDLVKEGFESLLPEEVDVSRVGEHLIVKTEIDYHRTIKERDLLNEIAEELGMEIKTDSRYYPWRKGYIFTDGSGQSSVTIISEKERLEPISDRAYQYKRGFGSYRPLYVKVTTEEIEPAEKLINLLVKKFHPSEN